MDDMARWVSEQLNEDERVVRENSDGHGLANGFPDYRTYSDGDTAAADEYIEHFGPERILREIKAKRILIAEHDWEWCPHCMDDPNGCPTRRAWVLPYSHRPGFRDEWRS